MNRLKQVLLAVVAMMAAVQISAADISGIKAVAGRVAPWLNGKIEAIGIPAENGNDVYEFSTAGNKLVIKANSMPAAGMALNDYLKHYCQRSFSMTGTNMAPVIGNLPEVSVPVRKVCPYRYRHFLNFCTQNYSGSFWDWSDWERMLDFMVLNGINLTISTTGLDKVWYNTLKQFNFSDEEIMKFLPGPAFNAWHMMGNLEGWGGPITKGMVDRRGDLQKRILKRMHDYGIEPVFMSFYGMVPVALKDKYPDADIKLQGKWAGGFDRPAVLVPGQDLYNRMADVYYKELKKLYGPFRYFAGEPFHEGGDRTGIDVAGMAKNVFDKMSEHFPDCKWVLQAWQGNPSSEFISRLSKDNVLIWDMKGELGAEWERRKGYDGFPFMWGVINNFGGTSGLYGRLNRFSQEWYRVRNSEYSKNLQGICASPEGLLNNPVNYDLLFEMAWNPNSVNVRDWVKDYSSYRYGNNNEDMADVWDILVQTAYSDKYDKSMVPPASKTLPAITGNSESVICAPPALNLHRSSSWGTNVMYYDYRRMRDIAPHLLNAIPVLKDVDAFRYDLVDFTRQMLANDFKESYHQLEAAVESGDISAFDTISAQMMDIMSDMDELMSTHPDFMVGTWINKAREQGRTAYEKDLFEKNARVLVTYWGPDSPTTDLRDYAHREWSGMIKDVYMPRWQNFFDYQKRRMMGIDYVPEHPVELEIAWAESRNPYPTEPQNDFVETATRILNKLIGRYRQ